MTTHHDPIDVTSGVPWSIIGTLYDAQDNLLDVTNCTMTWALLDPNGNPVPTTASISKTDPRNGGISIEVAKDSTRDPGRYTDALAVTEGTNTDVFWIGQILVAANPALV